MHARRATSPTSPTSPKLPTSPTLPMLVAIAALMAGSAAGVATLADQPSGQPDGQPAAPVPQPCSAASADQLLTELERADKGLKGMQAEIQLHRTFAFEGDEQTRIGMLYFSQVEPAEQEAIPLRRFCIQFHTLRVGKRIEEKEQKFAFDGQWLAETNTNEKRFERRQLVASGESFDPLKVGEGPLPIPIGQKKDDILARFDVELVAASEGLTLAGSDNPRSPAARQTQAWLRFVAGSCQLRLVPKPDAKDVDFTEIRLWYTKSGAMDGGEAGRWLPRMARTLNHAGDITIVQLVNVLFTDAIDEKYFSTAAPADRGWDTTEVPLKRAARLAAPGPRVIDDQPPAGAGPRDDTPAPSDGSPAASDPPTSPKSPS